MRSKYRALGLLLVLVLAFALVPAVAMAASMGSITGTVKDASTGYAVPFGEYSADASAGAGTDTAWVKAGYDGKVVLPAAVGTYTVYAQGPEYGPFGPTHEETSTDGLTATANSRPFGVGVAAATASPLDLKVTRRFQPVYRFFYKPGGTHFYTADDSEFINVYGTKAAQYSYDGIAYVLPVDSTINNTWVYRFFNMTNGTHFYTADPAEKLNVETKMSGTYRLDGPAYKVAVAQFDVYNSGAVYRYFNQSKNYHFYTMNQSEIDQSQQLSSLYKLEGIGFWIDQGMTYRNGFE